MDKSPDAFRTISEVAEHLETPAHVLRFWESRFPQIRPVKRAGGRRYYRPADVSLLTGIKRLLHDEGMTIRGVQKILREQGVRHVSGLSGDDMGGDAGADASEAGVFEDDFADVVVPLRAEPASERPEKATALAKAMGASRQNEAARPALNPALPRIEPEQGALLLTDIAPELPLKTTEDVLDDGSSAASDVTFQDVSVSADANPSAPHVFPEATQDDPDFGEDDPDDGPVIPLSTRIRALPSEASAVGVGAELLSVVARLQALRDRMADAAHPGRS